MDNDKEFSSVLGAVIASQLILLALIADNPKRSFLRKSMQHSGRHSCEYCFESGMLFSTKSGEDIQSFLKNIEQQKKELRQKIDNLGATNDTVQIETFESIIKHMNEAEKMAKKRKKCSHIVWPANTFDGEKRTKEKILSIVEQIETNPEMPKNEKKGIKGRSLLLDLDYFDYVISIPTEYMHLVPLGVVKRLIEVTFTVGENRTRNTKLPLASPLIFNECMKNIKVFKECSRRARKLDLAVMKAQELRNVLILFFPVVTKCLEGKDKEIKVWEMLAFMIRACVLRENEFENVNQNEIKYCMNFFYLNYQQLYGYQNCTYSIHVMSSHLLLMRSLGPLTETSAFRFENFYAELRKSFQPGTNSVVKQMIQNVLLKRILSKHVCEETIFYREKDTPLESNSIIYVYEDDKHVVYKIKSIQNNDIFICNQIGNHELTLPHTQMLNWSSVGVYRKGGTCSVDVNVSRKNIAGKVIVVEKYLITCPNNILREK